MFSREKAKLLDFGVSQELPDQLFPCGPSHAISMPWNIGYLVGSESIDVARETVD